MSRAECVYVDEIALVLLAGKSQEKASLLRLLEEYIEREIGIVTSTLALLRLIDYFRIHSDLQTLRTYLAFLKPLFLEIFELNLNDHELAIELMLAEDLEIVPALHRAIITNQGIQHRISALDFENLSTGGQEQL